MCSYGLFIWYERMEVVFDLEKQEFCIPTDVVFCENEFSYVKLSQERDIDSLNF